MTYHKKGRCFGAANHSAKLTLAQVLEIFQSKQKQVVLSIEFSVSESTIARIRNGKIWNHLTRTLRT